MNTLEIALFAALTFVSYVLHVSAAAVHRTRIITAINNLSADIDPSRVL